MMCSFPNPSSCLGQSPCSVNTKGSVQFSSVRRSVVSDSLRPHELQHARPPCPSPTPGVYSNSCPSSRWCHAATSSSVLPFSSCPCCTLPNGEPARVTSLCCLLLLHHSTHTTSGERCMGADSVSATVRLSLVPVWQWIKQGPYLSLLGSWEPSALPRFSGLPGFYEHDREVDFSSSGNNICAN